MAAIRCTSQSVERRVKKRARIFDCRLQLTLIFLPNFIVEGNDTTREDVSGRSGDEP